MSIERAAYNMLALEWGSDDQVRAECFFWPTVRARLSDYDWQRLELWGEKALLAEGVDYALYLIGEDGLRQHLETEIHGYKCLEFFKMENWKKGGRHEYL